MCRLGCCSCAALGAHTTLPPKRLAPSAAPKRLAPRAGVHPKRWRSPKTALRGVGWAAVAASGSRATARRGGAKGCRAEHARERGGGDTRGHGTKGAQGLGERAAAPSSRNPNKQATPRGSHPKHQTRAPDGHGAPRGTDEQKPQRAQALQN